MMVTSMLLQAGIIVSLLSASHSLPDPLERYDLTTCALHADGTIPAQKAESSLTGALIPSNAGDFACENGVCPLAGRVHRVVSMESNHTLANFQRHFDQVGMLSVSLWMTPTGSAFSGLRPILTLGGTGGTPRESTSITFRSSNENAHDSTTTSLSMGCRGYDFRLAQLDDTLMMAYSNIHGACAQVRLDTMQLSNTLTHTAVTFGLTDVHIYINGANVPFSYDGAGDRNGDRDGDRNDGIRDDNGSMIRTIYIPNWQSMATGKLTLFSSDDNGNDEDNVFLGSISEVALYDQILSADEVTALFLLGASASQPPSMAPVGRTTAPSNAPVQIFRTRGPFQAPLHVPSWIPSSPPFTSLPTSVPTTFTPTVGATVNGQPSLIPSVPSSMAGSAVPSLLPSGIPSVIEPIVDDTASIVREWETFTWHTIAFFVIGSSILSFCVWSFFGGWPRCLVATVSSRRPAERVFWGDHAVPA